IVFNTFAKGEWGKEERKSNPYKKGDDIDIRIRAHDSKFSISVDQKEVKEYEHRVPLSSVTHFSIDGDILVTYIHWGGKYYVSYLFLLFIIIIYYYYLILFITI
ncbi:unnamed protein product, partial [Anisakis simplex]|uniref:Galectin n=1 Tax=Anisakis simplex TaxID=6269 RepID=A0A0M3JA06_ANISI